MKDACEICRGRNGGVPGNENIIDRVVMCDYCHSNLLDARAEIDYRAGERVEIGCTHLVGATVGACAACIAKAIAAAEERGRVEKLTLADAKALAMEARTESLRVVLTEAAKAQQEASDVTFAMASESGRGWDPDAHLMPIAEAILGAEERGRRSGVEEAIRKAEAYFKLHTSQPQDLIRALHAALAPRDSAPVCDAVLSSDPFREWRCGKPKGHEGPHSGDRK